MKFWLCQQILTYLHTSATVIITNVCWDLVVHHYGVALPGDGDALGPEQLAGPQPGLVLAVSVKQRHALVFIVRHRDQPFLWVDIAR